MQIRTHIHVHTIRLVLAGFKKNPDTNRPLQVISRVRLRDRITSSLPDYGH